MVCAPLKFWLTYKARSIIPSGPKPSAHLDLPFLIPLFFSSKKGQLHRRELRLPDFAFCVCTLHSKGFLNSVAPLFPSLQHSTLLFMPPKFCICFIVLMISVGLVEAVGPQKHRHSQEEIHPNKRVHLNKFFWTMYGGFLTRVTGRRQKPPQTFRKTSCKCVFLYFGIWGGLWDL